MTSAIGYDYVATADDISSTMLSFDVVRIYRLASQAGAATLISTQTLVAGQAAYPYHDDNAVSTSWFTHEFYNTVTFDVTPRVEASPAVGALIWTALQLLRAVAHELQCFGLPEGYTDPTAVSGTVTTTGSTSGWIDTRYKDSLYPHFAFSGWYACFRSGTAYAGAVNEVRVATLDGTTGTFATARALSAIATIGDTYDLFGQRPSAFWFECLFGIRGACLDLWQPVAYPIAGAELDGSEVQREYDLPYFFESPDQVLRVTGRSGASTGTHLFTGGTDVHIVGRQNGGVTLQFPGGLSPQQVVMVEGYRHLAPLTAITDTVVLSSETQRLLVLGGAVRALEFLVDDPYLGSTDRRRWQDRLSRMLPNWHAQVEEAGAWRQSGTPRQGRMTNVSAQGQSY